MTIEELIKQYRTDDERIKSLNERMNGLIDTHGITNFCQAAGLRRSSVRQYQSSSIQCISEQKLAQAEYVLTRL